MRLFLGRRAKKVKRSSFSQKTAIISMFVINSLTLSACGSRNQPSQVKIYGGLEVAENARMNVVAITDGDGVFCSGTALTPKLIVTAAHCTIDTRAEDVKVYVGAGVEGGDVQGQYSVEKIAYSPFYNDQDYESNFDVGYLVLKDALDIPADAYTKVLTDTAEIKELLIKGADSYLVGFGTRKKNGYGVKYETMTPVKKVLMNEVVIGANGKDACQGDSGGPAFGKLANGEWRVYGVVSRGGQCGNGGNWGLLHKNICWVQKDSNIDVGLPAAYCVTQ
jgi:secreted trypsin-like serine protease